MGPPSGIGSGLRYRTATVSLDQAKAVPYCGMAIAEGTVLACDALLGKEHVRNVVESEGLPEGGQEGRDTSKGLRRPISSLTRIRGLFEQNEQNARYQ